MTQNQLAKERRELRQAQVSSLIDQIPKDFNKSWIDPHQSGRQSVQTGVERTGTPRPPSPPPSPPAPFLPLPVSVPPYP
ncbi:hypothetical protein Naga_102772g1 [Nannochloropsis gaditana]|uniref:Uncharacterized protein n=1 Tax=Nannochloropsis gaditana TaxID=72520 RepID=W7TKI3_9STRA|nr:hypothetical protein Naga_102772g1 [Nannochloropsis gaditana]